MRFAALDSLIRKRGNSLPERRWFWHLAFWTGYAAFRFWLYYITVKHYPGIFLEYMLLSEILFIAATYLTLWLYRRLFQTKKHLAYFLAGTGVWVLYLCGRTAFQFWYLKSQEQFQGSRFSDVFLSNITVVILGFLFITACKYVKDSYMSQQAESARKEQQLMAEVNNLKLQIAPHFLFNTLNNFYGLAVDKSDKLPDLMLRLSNLLRHSLYETQHPTVPLGDEVAVLKSYIELERIRLEDDLELEFSCSLPEGSRFGIAPLLLIVFVENAFKHSKFIRSGPVKIWIRMSLEAGRFMLMVKNNYNSESGPSAPGIGLFNVRRRLDVLYPKNRYELLISSDDRFYTILLQLQLDPLIP